MVALRVEADIRFYYIRADNTQIKVAEGRTETFSPNNGDRDPQLWKFLPLVSKAVSEDQRIRITANGDFVKTLDSTDYYWQIPVMRKDLGSGVSEQLDFTKKDFESSDIVGFDKFKDKTLAPTDEIIVGEYTVKGNELIKLGGAKIFFELLDDTV